MMLMRVAFYNQMFALDGSGFWSNVLGHWAVHFQNDDEIVTKWSDLGWTGTAVRDSKSDIVGLAEILEGQEEEIRGILKGLDYDYIHFGRGHKTEFRDSYVQVALASKIECKRVDVNGFPTRNEMGGGGGHCSLLFFFIGFRYC
jgi:hypothetical protein